MKLERLETVKVDYILFCGKNDHHETQAFMLDWRLVTKTKTYSFLFLYFAAFHLILAAMFFRNLDNSENRRIVAKIWKWYFKQAYNILYNRVINRFSNICFFYSLLKIAFGLRISFRQRNETKQPKFLVVFKYRWGLGEPATRVCGRRT